MSRLKYLRDIQWVRRIVQGVLLALTAFLGLRHQFGSGGSPIDAYCPFGGVESFYTWVTQGKMLAKTSYSNLLLLGILLLMTLFVGGIFCGWLCPLGTVQEWLYALRRKIIKKPLPIPERLDKMLRYLKYVFWAFILFMTIRRVTLWFENYDPFKVLFHFKFETTTAYVVLGLTILFSLLIERFWCKYLCPLGALLSPLAKIGLIKVKKTDDCSQCNLCLRNCSMGLKDIGEQGCINCLECVTSCPKATATTLRIGAQQSRRPILLLPMFGILMGLLAILGTMGAGVWETRTAMSSVALPATAGPRESGYPPVESITGMAYLDEVAKTYHLAPEEILKQAGLDPKQNPHQTLKDIVKKAGKEVEVIRQSVEALQAKK